MRPKAPLSGGLGGLSFGGILGSMLCNELRFSAVRYRVGMYLHQTTPAIATRLDEKALRADIFTSVAN
jgi:hypothetical protein